MNLQNGYKVIYEKAADGKRTFYASTDGLFAGADVIAEVTIGEYKLVYEKDGKIYGSTTGIPANDDFCFEAFDKVFKKVEDGASVEEDDNVSEGTEETTSEEEPTNNEVTGDNTESNTEEDDIVGEDDEDLE